MKRQPDITRRALLTAAKDVVTQQGVANFTLETVAQRAGVSKGALLHHFHSKKDLIEAMVKDLVQLFSELVQASVAKDPDPHGRSARAYVRVIANQTKAEYDQFAAMSAAFLSDASLMELWRRSVAQSLEADTHETEDTTGTMIVRLAADGLWTSDLYGTYRFEDSRRKAVLDRLVAMTYA
jgi:AcrR family transcriptional regulator